MQPSGKIIFVAKGFPWCALLAWGAMVAIIMVVGLNVLHVKSAGGIFLVAALFGNAAFAAMLGRR